MEMIKNITTVPASITGANAINSAGGITSLLSKGATPTVGGTLNEAGLPTEIGVISPNAGKHVLNTAGKVAGAIGAAYGAYNIGSDIANAGSHRSISDMRNTMATKTYTTAGGNQYIAHSGPNISAELDYEKQAAK